MSMKIVALEVQDFMRVKMARLDLAGKNFVPICGENAVGKSSLLNGFWWLIGGRDFPHGTVVREGADRARVRGELGDIIVEKVQVAGEEARLVVTTPEGAKYPRPQKVLDELISKIAFDPQAFAMAKPDEQAAMVQQLIGIDWSALDEQRAGIFEGRTQVNREVRRLEGVLSSMAEVEAPDEEVSVAALLEEQKVRMQTEAERQRRDRAVDEAVKAVTEAEHAVKVAHEALEAAQREQARAVKAQTQALEAFQAIPDPDVQAVTSEIAQADAVNARVRQKRARRETGAALETQRLDASRLTDRILAIDAQKRDQASAAKFPIEGLGFADDGTLTYQGVPFSQAADSAKLRTGVALGIALSPKLPVLLIRQGSLLDTANLEMIRDMVEAADAQVLVEIVGHQVEGGFWIEDGEIVEPPRKESPHAAP